MYTLKEVFRMILIVQSDSAGDEKKIAARRIRAFGMTEVLSRCLTSLWSLLSVLVLVSERWTFISR